MLLKVFRHDFKTLVRFEVPVMLGLLAASVLGFLDFVFLGWGADAIDHGSTSTATMILMIVCVIGMFFIGLALTAAVTVMSCMPYYRFYKSMVTDEAYLTLTLPVKPKDLLFGKLFSTLLWTLIIGVASTAAFSIFFSGAAFMPGVKLSEVTEAFSMLGTSFIVLFGEGVLPKILFAINMAVGIVFGVIQIFFAIIFAGSIVKKHKILCAIGMVFATNMIVNSISSIVSIFFTAGLAVSEMSGADTGIVYSVTYGVSALVYAGLAVLFFWLSCYLVRNKVNLE